MTGTNTNITSHKPMDRTRKIALVAGGLYILTFIASIPALGFYDKVLHDPTFVLGSGGSSAVAWGALLEMITGLAGIGTAVVLYPLTRRQSETAALGFVTTRVLEAAMIFAGVLSLLSVVSMRQGALGSSDAAVTNAQSMVAFHNWTFLLGPGFMPALNALLLGSVMYRSRLVPRIIPTIGLIGAPLLIISSTASLFGAWDQISSTAMLFALPIATWEFSLGMWMLIKGFRPAAVAQLSRTDATTSEIAMPQLVAA